MDGKMHPPQANRGGRLRLLVASDVRFVRESLGEFLGKSDTISIVGHCGGADVLAQSRALNPDMALLDASAHDGLSLHEMRPHRLALRYSSKRGLLRTLASRYDFCAPDG